MSDRLGEQEAQPQTPDEMPQWAVTVRVLVPAATPIAALAKVQMAVADHWMYDEENWGDLPCDEPVLWEFS